MNSLLSTAYWPNLHYFFYLLNSENIKIEQFENFQKQSYRNRTCILTANGILHLSVPVKKQAIKELTKDIEISYKERWQPKHWRAILSAYKNSPYFEFFEEEIFEFYNSEYQNLLEYNTAQVNCILKILKVTKPISFTTEYIKKPHDLTDLRESIHPKTDFKEDSKVLPYLIKPYYQTFQEKFGFTPNLSILDLVFNTGLGARGVLSSEY